MVFIRRSCATGFGGGGVGGGGASAGFAAGCAGGRCVRAGCCGAAGLGGVWPRAPGRVVVCAPANPDVATTHDNTRAEMVKRQIWTDMGHLIQEPKRMM